MFKIKRYIVRVPIAKEGYLTLGKDFKVIGAELTKKEYDNLGVFKPRVTVEEKTVESVEAYLKLNPELDYSEVSDKAKGNTQTDKPKEEEETIVDSELEELRNEYTQLTGKNLSPRFKNDKEWLKSQIKESKNA